MLRKIENFYCHLIGWNPEILAECSEASFALMKKYVSAIFILSLLWGTIGYCFAEKYLERSKIANIDAAAAGFSLLRQR